MSYEPYPPSGNARMDLARLAFSYVVTLMDERRHPVTADPVANQALLTAIYKFIARSEDAASGV
jgi:hypothetical protein